MIVDDVWILGDVKSGFPPFGPPPFSTSVNGTTYYFGDMAADYGVSIAFIPLVSILEAISIAKAFSTSKILTRESKIILYFQLKASL